MKADLIYGGMNYVQSANSIFHFMKQSEYLKSALGRRGLVPRYCEEDISYLDIKVNDKLIDKILVLQKCFCDVPLHKLTEKFSIIPDEEELKNLDKDEREEVLKNSTHPDYYGEYAIAFSKQWCIGRNLQPVHYVNSESEFAKEFKQIFEYAISQEDLDDVFFNDVINRLCYLKPLYGEMVRKLKSNKVIHISKNFHDEKEWRYVPEMENLCEVKKGKIIVKPSIAERKEMISNDLENGNYQRIWLQFEYDDIRYILVPNSAERIELINYINNIPNEQFKDDVPISIQKNILMSKILVLDEIKEDW